MIDRYRPHVLVLPEDDANRQMANGFVLHPGVNSRTIQILDTAGGWASVVEYVKKDGNINHLRKFEQCRVVLLLDYDNQFPGRFDSICEKIPGDLRDRVYVLGVLSEPEELKSDLKKPFEKIGNALASECCRDVQEVWQHPLLRHNHGELVRLIQDVTPFLFGNQ